MRSKRFSTHNTLCLMRDLHPDFKEVIRSGHYSPIMMVELDTLPEPIYLWTGIGDLVYAGKTYLGTGALGAIEPIKESAEIKAESVTLSLYCMKDLIAEDGDGIDFNALRECEIKEREGRIFYGLLGDDGNELIAVEPAFCGDMDALRVINRPTDYEIKLTIFNRLIILKKRENLWHTDVDQQYLHPGDTSHRFVHAIQDLQIRL